MQKALTDMNLPWPPVISDITGVTGMSLMPAVVGEYGFLCSLTKVHYPRGMDRLPSPSG